MRPTFLISAILSVLAAPLAAQLGLPRASMPDVRGVLEAVTDPLEDATAETRRTTERLAQQRLRTIDRLVRRNEGVIERDARGEPARRGELLVTGADAAALRILAENGFTVLSREEIEGLGFTVLRVGVPADSDLAEAEMLLTTLLPDAETSADNLHFQSGASTKVSVPAASSSANLDNAAPVGMIDGAPGAGMKVTSTRGFAKGAPYPSNHGSAVASLLDHAGARDIRVADVYGKDKAGGNALAIAKALGWLTASGSKVVTISLVGPRNPVLERAIVAARRKGVVVVAAVGNDGPAAPPAYPASYDGVIAVTAVDGKRRALIEAGRALHLDYAAPGADIYGRNAKGKRITLRGTSFATPLVAARAAHAIGAGKDWRDALDEEAVDLGRKGPDGTFGRGLVCGSCKGR